MYIYIYRWGAGVCLMARFVAPKGKAGATGGFLSHGGTPSHHPF